MVDLVRADHAAHFVVQDLGGGAGQRTEAGAPEFREEFAQRQPERVRALPHLERREGVHVDVRRRRFDRPADVEIGLAGVVRVDAALQADLGRAPLPGFAGAARDLLEIHLVGHAAKILGQLALGERAEAAVEVADVGVVDVAIDHVADARRR